MYSNSYILLNFRTNECFTITELPQSSWWIGTQPTYCRALLIGDRALLIGDRALLIGDRALLSFWWCAEYQLMNQHAAYWCCTHHLILQKSLITYQKSPITFQKSPIIYQKSPITCQKSPAICSAICTSSDTAYCTIYCTTCYCRALLIGDRALLISDRALLISDRALLISDRALLIGDRTLLSSRFCWGAFIYICIYISKYIYSARLYTSSVGCIYMYIYRY